jgi:hypothetical protein
MFLNGHDGLIKRTEGPVTDVPIARQGMYTKFIVQSDWMHHGEGLQLFNRMGRDPSDPLTRPGAAMPGSHGRGSG